MKKSTTWKPAMFHRILSVVSLLLMLLRATTAMPAATFIHNLGEFPQNSTLLTFQGLSPFSQPTVIAGVRFSLENGQGPDVALDPARPREFGPFEGTVVQNIASGFLDLTLSFPTPVTAAAFEMRTRPSENIKITLFYLSSVADLFTLQTRNTFTGASAPLYFYGFQTELAFDRMLIDIQSSNGGFFEMDNLRFTPVPEPAVGYFSLIWAVILSCSRKSGNDVRD